MICPVLEIILWATWKGGGQFIWGKKERKKRHSKEKALTIPRYGGEESFLQIKSIAKSSDIWDSPEWTLSHVREGGRDEPRRIGGQRVGEKTGNQTVVLYRDGQLLKRQTRSWVGEV